MKTIKVSELTGAALDWVAAKCEGVVYDNPAWTSYSSDWAQGGPIIEREAIAMSPKPDGLWAAYAPKGARLVQHEGRAVEVFNWYFKQEGSTPLIAAMRCYVASKLGDSVEIPEELL